MKENLTLPVTVKSYIFLKKNELISHIKLMRKYNILLFFLFGGTPDKIPFLPNLSVFLSSSPFLYVKHLKQQPEANKAKVKIHQRSITRTYVDGRSRFRSTLAFFRKNSSVPRFFLFSTSFASPRIQRVSTKVHCGPVIGHH